VGEAVEEAVAVDADGRGGAVDGDGRGPARAAVVGLGQVRGVGRRGLGGGGQRDREHMAPVAARVVRVLRTVSLRGCRGRVAGPGSPASGSGRPVRTSPDGSVCARRASRGRRCSSRTSPRARYRVRPGAAGTGPCRREATPWRHDARSRPATVGSAVPVGGPTRGVDDQDPTAPEDATQGRVEARVLRHAASAKAGRGARRGRQVRGRLHQQAAARPAKQTAPAHRVGPAAFASHLGEQKQDVVGIALVLLGVLAGLGPTPAPAAPSATSSRRSRAACSGSPGTSSRR
jgi:hypothetical protein